MIKYQGNKNAVIQKVEIDLTKIPVENRQDLESKIAEVRSEYNNILKYDNRNNKLVYKTEVLIPKVINDGKLNLLMVLGNPAIHSVATGMFFSYEKARSKEGKENWREHRFWRALRDCRVLTFYKDVEKPTPENIKRINEYKRDCLLNGNYHSEFNIFFLPYFSFPTPSSGKYSGVDGIPKIVSKDVFAEMKRSEFQRFERIVLSHNIKNIICFQQHALKEIVERTECKEIDNIEGNPVYELDDALKHVLLYKAAPTRYLHTDKGKRVLETILADIKKTR